MVNETKGEVLEHQPSLIACLENVGKAITGMPGAQEANDVKLRWQLNQNIYPIPQIPCGQLTAATGVGSLLDLPDLMGPKTGQNWFVWRVSCTGFTAGAVNVYYNNQNSAIIYPITQSGVAYFSKTQFPVLAGNRLVFAAGTGYSGTANIEIGVINVSSPWLAAFL